MKIIAVEEHFFIQTYVDYIRAQKLAGHFKKIKDSDGKEYELMDSVVPRPGEMEECLDVGEGRLRDMDEAGVDMQVLSFSAPGVEAMDVADAKVMARKVNDELAEKISKHPKRFAGFATIAAHEPESAALELERAVKQLGLKGVKFNSHVKGEYLDAPKFRPIFEMAQKLDVPVYLHPRAPSPDIIKPYLTYPVLVSNAFGFGAETSLHTLRLICSGLFDEYPKLKMILGHLGEGLPFFLWRLKDHRWDKVDVTNPLGPHTKEEISYYVKNNFYVTTSGNFFVPALLCTIMALGVDHIMFAVDYPFESSTAAVAFIESAPICDADKEKIFHLNAEKILKL